MKKIPQKTITRSFLYIRTLDKLISEKEKFVSSRKLADISGLTDVQVRKDISRFGKVGKPRIGYETKVLKKKLEDFIMQNVLHVALFGVGNLGAAILKYPGFHQDKVKLVAAFDNDPQKVGQEINGVPIYSLKNVSAIIKKSHAEIGVIAVPKEVGQRTADVIVKSGLKGIVNFSPSSIIVPKNVFVRNIDLTIEFLSLFCDING